jgi:hypothetical protein
MKRTLLTLAIALAASSVAQADDGSTLPFMKDLAGGHDLPRPYGISIDLLTMKQDYGISSLNFSLPGVGAIDTSEISVKNDLFYNDLKFDAWVFPFLNVFAMYGHINAQTDVDLSSVAIPGLPVSLGTLPVKYSGNVYGGGLTLAYGGDHWFTSLTGSWTHSNLNGDFDSKVKAYTLQPKLGYINGPWQTWVGGLDLHTEEKHSGSIVLPYLGNVPFGVTLKEKASWSPVVGVRYSMGRFANVTLEIGGGQRTTTLLNVDLRFPRDKD